MASAAAGHLEKFRIGPVLSESFAVIGRNFWLCCLLVLIFRILPQIIFSVWAWVIFGHGAPDNSANAIVFRIVRIVGYPTLFAMLQVAVALMAIEDRRNGRPTLRNCLEMVYTLLFPATGIWLLAHELLYIGGSIGGYAVNHYAIDHYFRLLSGKFPSQFLVGMSVASVAPAFIPGLVLWTRWFVATPVLIGEGAGVFGSLARSRDLTRGARWRLVGYWLGLWGASFLIALASRHWRFPFGISLRALSDAVESVITAVVMAISYIELLRIKEGTSAENLAEIFL